MNKGKREYELDYVHNLLRQILIEHGENWFRLKAKAKRKKMSLSAVIMEWGHPRDWEK